LLAYLAAYRSLRVLALAAATGEDEDEDEDEEQSNTFARKFYGEVLPMHASTLEELHITALFHGSWVRPEFHLSIASMIAERGVSALEITIVMHFLPAVSLKSSPSR
jgi:Flp pilus assembly protein TadG